MPRDGVGIRAAYPHRTAPNQDFSWAGFRTIYLGNRNCGIFLYGDLLHCSGLSMDKYSILILVFAR